MNISKNSGNSRWPLSETGLQTTTGGSSDSESMNNLANIVTPCAAMHDLHKSNIETNSTSNTHKKKFTVSINDTLHGNNAHIANPPYKTELKLYEEQNTQVIDAQMYITHETKLYT